MLYNIILRTDLVGIVERLRVRSPYFICPKVETLQMLDNRLKLNSTFSTVPDGRVENAESVLNVVANAGKSVETCGV